jgi:putative membrane protein
MRMALVPRSVKHAQAHRRAVAQFLAQNLYTTVGHTGVLIFVSVAEGFAEILADGAISAKVSQSEWDAIVADLTQHIGRGEAAEGFVRAIRAVGAHLARHYPPLTQGGNTLPNHLIVLPPA